VRGIPKFAGVTGSAKMIEDGFRKHFLSWPTFF
jgi:hypothetical protein